MLKLLEAAINEIDEIGKSLNDVESEQRTTKQESIYLRKVENAESFELVDRLRPKGASVSHSERQDSVGSPTVLYSVCGTIKYAFTINTVQFVQLQARS